MIVFILGSILIIKLAPYSIFLYVILLYTWMLQCEILSDRLGGDHYPIIITANTSDHPVPERVPKWNFKWEIFQD